jgi:hypothetical protein
MEPDDREFMRELLLRHEKATNAMIARLDKGTEDIARRTEEVRIRIEQIKRSGDAHTEALRAHTREFVAEMQAQRQALFRVLDRLDGQGA